MERQYRKIKRDNERNVHRHAGEWWKECALIDVDALRSEVSDGEFLKRRVAALMHFGGRPLEHWERQVLKELVSHEQRERYERWVPIANAWKRRGVYF